MIAEEIIRSNVWAAIPTNKTLRINFVKMYIDASLVRKFDMVINFRLGDEIHEQEHSIDLKNAEILKDESFYIRVLINKVIIPSKPANSFSSTFCNREDGISLITHIVVDYDFIAL
jgi:hypothetical protein